MARFCLLLAAFLLAACNNSDSENGDGCETDASCACGCAGGGGDPDPEPEPKSNAGGIPASNFMQYNRTVVEKTAQVLQTGDKKARGMALMSLPTDKRHFQKNPEVYEEVVVPALINVFEKDAEKSNRHMAAMKLAGMMPHPKIEAAFLAALDDPERRQSALDFGAQMKERAPAVFVNKIAAFLDSEDKSLQQKAAVALQQLGPGALPALDKLVAALKSDIAHVRLRAASAIDRIGPKAARALPDVKAALAVEKKANVKFHLERAVKSLGG